MSTATTAPPRIAAGEPSARDAALSTGVTVFICVATSLFFLLVLAYALRITGGDWVPLDLPPQLWLSTALLVATSLALRRAGSEARRPGQPMARRLLLAAGICALAFLGAQWWAWEVLQARRVMPTTHPAASFFFLLTAFHALHALGGLVGWWIVAYGGSWQAPERRATGIRIVARYWHFLLAAWLVLYATLGGLTPEIVLWICGQSGAPT